MRERALLISPMEISQFHIDLLNLVLLAFTGTAWLMKRLSGAQTYHPLWLRASAGLFPWLAVALVLRTFFFESFIIPSGSMIPTLRENDFVLVNKIIYGIRLPALNRKIIDIGIPARGETIVFRYPPDPSLLYIKRVVGVPGDHIEYVDKTLTINGERITTTPAGSYLHPGGQHYLSRLVEKLGDAVHEIVLGKAPPALSPTTNYPFRDQCQYNEHGLSCLVPPGHYFVMGDNRDGSSDSRVWGFVPDIDIVGQALFIWFNPKDLDRIGVIR